MTRGVADDSTMVLITDPEWAASLKAEREHDGHDWRDEVWNGVYVMSPSANNLHQRIAFHLGMAFYAVVDAASGGSTHQVCNVSDRARGWNEDYRVPDVSVYLAGNPAIDHGTHWEGGGDFVVEILSPGDLARRKRDFYASVGVREFLVIDRYPWALELYRARDSKLGLVAKTTTDGAEVLTSEVLPLTFRLVPGDDQPQIEVARSDGGATWTI